MKKRYSYNILFQFVTEVFFKIGCKKADAELIAEVLLAAELRGIPSHGLARVKTYLGLWEVGRITLNNEVKVVHETLSTATIDNGNGFGMLGAKKAMKLAIEKAKIAGTGWVSVLNSNHFGIAGYYAMLALKDDMIGITMTNASPLVAPTWSTSRFLGTNPIAVAIPAENYPPFVADFATTPIAQGKLSLIERKGKKCNKGFVQDKEGIPSTNPAILKQGGAIVPLGSDYEHGSHKGYCLGAIVDIFSSVFSGANFGPFTPPQVAFLPLSEKSTGLGIGHFFGAIRIDAFRPASEFKKSMDQWIETFKNAAPTAGHEKVLIPGEPEKQNTEYNLKNGIDVLPDVEVELIKIAEKYNVTIYK
ncbi:MAG: malate dehydrogenase [Bacteroidetes bacterium GWA2_32_17]|nr:MAG: malate dehydrogenase [Bacteroidetes bacterium GWA2_32_17]